MRLPLQKGSRFVLHGRVTWHGKAQTTDHICHCEASKKPWQSPGSIVQLKCPVRQCPEIATSASPPRNDRGNRSPGADHRPHLSLRGPIGAVAIRTLCRQCPQERAAKRTDCHVGLRPPRNDAVRGTDCHGWGVRPNGFSLPTVYHTACGAAKVFSRRQISSLHPGAFTLK